MFLADTMDFELTEEFRDLCISPLINLGRTPPAPELSQAWKDLGTGEILMECDAGKCRETIPFDSLGITMLGTPRRDPLRKLLTKSTGHSLLSQRVSKMARKSFSKSRSEILTTFSPSSLADITNVSAPTTATPRSLPSFGVTNHSRRSIMAEFCAIKERLAASSGQSQKPPQIITKNLNLDKETVLAAMERPSNSPATCSRRQCTPKLLFLNDTDDN